MTASDKGIPVQKRVNEYIEEALLVDESYKLCDREVPQDTEMYTLTLLLLCRDVVEAIAEMMAMMTFSCGIKPIDVSLSCGGRFICVHQILMVI